MCDTLKKQNSCFRHVLYVSFYNIIKKKKEAHIMQSIDSQLAYLPLHEAAKLIRTGQVSPVELTELMLARIADWNPKLNAFVTLTAELAMEQAKQAEREIADGRYRGPLHGIPIVHKDLYYTKGIRTTCSSKILKDFVPDYDATSVGKLKDAGTVLLGKVQTHEFASGATTSSPHFGPCLNPWNLERVPGGSSGGSGAAVAAGLAYMGTGTDTGGSIRIPAACCGVVGIKPTYGRVSRHGIFPMGWTLDHAGPITRTVKDAALCLQAMAGYDPNDRSTLDLPVPDYTAMFGIGLKGVRIGIPTNYYNENVDPAVEDVIDAAIRQFAALGAETVEVKLPTLDYVGATTMGILSGEIVAIHEPWIDSRPEDYGPDVRAMLEGGRQVPASGYLQAQRARRLILDDYRKALSEVDVLITPALPITVPRCGDALGGARLAEFTMPTNVTGLPSLSMPCGFSPDGLPINMQLIGRPFEEATVLAIGHAYEESTDWHNRHPELPADRSASPEVAPTADATSAAGAETAIKAGPMRMLTELDKLKELDLTGIEPLVPFVCEPFGKTAAG
jgi:aspartyl-tRNA(Asn)/glutamyl-tRNA(Gln) amidotransferase subunit A